MISRLTLRTHGWIALAAVVLAACTSEATPPEEDVPSAADAARTFVAHWNDADYPAMVATMVDPTETWTTKALDRFVSRQFRRGAVTSQSVALGGEVEQPDSAAFEAAEEDGDPLTVTAPIRLEYESEVVADLVVFEGGLELAYEAADERWIPQWDRSLLWPGFEAAASFEVMTKWPTRGPIVDRTGRTLAAGPTAERRYPFASVGGSVVGHIEPLTQADAGERVAQPGDLVGGSGLEEAYDEVLAGRPATRLVLLDSEGERLSVLGRTAAIPGRKVKTTIDIEVQRAAENAYGSTTGGAVVLDPRTGGVLAAVASGPFDPNNYVGVAGINPFNRALAGLYPPGSAMKVVTASAALEEGVVTPETTVTGPKEYQGVRNFESGEFGSIPFASALKYSVNTAFAQVAEKLGARRLSRYAEAFGFNREPEMDLAAAAPSFPPPVGLGDVMWASIGQAQVLATPLEMATVAATIANHGKRMEPRSDARATPSGDRVVSRGTAAQMTEMMENVVIGGTGSAARVTGLSIAGKTGTAEVDVNGERKNHAWFIAFTPVEDPLIAVAVVSEYGGVGGQVAAPLARQIITSVLPLLQ